MATTISKTHCVTCGKDKVAYKCEGCLQTFCINHLSDHHRELGLQLDGIEDKRNLVRQILTEYTKNPQQHALTQQINQWEHESINKIRQTADRARQLLAQYVTEHINEMEVKLAELTRQLKVTRQENDFNELHVNQFNQQLKQLEEQLNKQSNISIRQDSSSFIGRISVVTPSSSLSILNISANSKWMPNGITVAGGYGKGNELNQLCYPWDLYMDDEQSVYVADQNNHRIIEWKVGAASGRVVAGGNGAGNQNNQLHYPMCVILDKKTDSLIISNRGSKRVMRWPRRNGTSGETLISDVDYYELVMTDDGYMYVSDITKNEVRRYGTGDRIGTIVAGGNNTGYRLDQLNKPYFIFVDQDHSVYVSDCGNCRVIKWMNGAREGIVVAGGQGEGNSLAQLSSPFGVVVDQLGTVYVVDSGNSRVMRWPKGATQGNVVIGGNGIGGQANQLNLPRALRLDKQNNIYVVDYANCRVQKFYIEPNSMK